MMHHVGCLLRSSSGRRRVDSNFSESLQVNLSRDGLKPSPENPPVTNGGSSNADVALPESAIKPLSGDMQRLSDSDWAPSSLEHRIVTSRNDVRSVTTTESGGKTVFTDDEPWQW